MNWKRIVSLVLLTVLLIAYFAALEALEPGSETKTSTQTVVVENDTFWWKQLELPPNRADYGTLRHSITMRGLNNADFDVYLLRHDPESSNSEYRTGQDFYFEMSEENISNPFTFVQYHDHYDMPLYLVVDNWDNGRSSDAYANETLSVKITHRQKQMYEDGRYDLLLVGGMCCSLPLLVLGPPFTSSSINAGLQKDPFPPLDSLIRNHLFTPASRP